MLVFKEVKKAQRKMATKSALLSFQVLLICTLYVLTFGSHVRKLTSDDLRNIGQSTKNNFIAVFFDKPDIRNSYPKFAREFVKSSDVLEPFGIELAQVDCSKHPINQCSSKEQKVFVYRRGDPDVLERIDLSYMFNEDSIVANLLQTALSGDFIYVSDKESFDELLFEGHGRKDVVLCFVKGLGMKEHRHFLELVHYAKHDAIFALTTDGGITKQYGLSTDHNAGLLLFHCKEKTNSKGQCRLTQFKGKLDKIQLIRFLQSQTLPKYVILPSDRATVFDSLTFPVNRVFVFSDKISDLQSDKLEQMAVEFQGSIGVILVDVNEHKDMLSSFGLAKDGNFPTAAYVPAKIDNDSKTYMELYPENVVVFTINNLKGFIKPLVENPSDEYTRLAEASSLQKLSYAEYSDAMNNMDTNYLLDLDFLLVVFCQEDTEPCMEFSETLRRIVRSFDRAGQSRITVAYVKTSLHKKRFEGETFPVIHLHLTKSRDDFIQFAGKLDYEVLMDFITSHTKLRKPVSLPPSLSDATPISFPLTSDSKEDSQELNEELDEEAYEADEEPDYDSEPLPDVETEDDEVAASVLKAKPVVVPEGLVPALTDKTFDVIKNENDLLVVNFYQPWDARCKAFLQPYVDAADHLSNLDVGDFAIKLARVNCFDWTDVCQKNNITVYPTIKMFRKGSDEIIYNGPLDSDHLSKAVLLLEHSVPLALNSKDEVDKFFDGNLPKLAKTATDIAVVGMFLNKNNKEFKAFESAAQSLKSRFLLGFVTGDTAKTLSSEYGLSVPSLFVFKRNDPYQPINVFDGQFTMQSIVDFVLRSNLPSFGELTPFNLPVYLTQKKPLLIVFRADSEESVITPVMTKLARDKTFPSVFLCWMPVYSNNDVNAEILKSYTGSGDSLPALVLVNHYKGAVYLFKDEVTKPVVKAWVEDILSGKEQHTGLFAEAEWKPRLEGYDFLRMIDEEEEKKERKRLKTQRLEAALKRGDNDDPVWPPPETEKLAEEKKSSRLRRPEVKIYTRDEL